MAASRSCPKSPYLKGRQCPAVALGSCRFCSLHADLWGNPRLQLITEPSLGEERNRIRVVSPFTAPRSALALGRTSPPVLQAGTESEMGHGPASAARCRNHHDPPAPAGRGTDGVPRRDGLVTARWATGRGGPIPTQARRGASDVVCFAGAPTSSLATKLSLRCNRIDAFAATRRSVEDGHVPSSALCIASRCQELQARKGRRAGGDCAAAA